MMNTFKSIGAAGMMVMAATSICISIDTETYYVVEISDYAKAETCKMLSKDELKQMTDEIKKETSLMPKTLAAAEKAWKEDETYGKKNFPRTAITPRTMKVKKQTNNQEEAAKTLETFDENAKKIEKRKVESANRKYEVRGSNYDARVRAAKAKAAEQKKEDTDKEEEKEKFLEAARNLFLEQLEIQKAIADGKTPDEAMAAEKAEKEA